MPDYLKHHKHILICALLIIMIVAVYGQTMRHGFSTYDDPQYVTENPHVTSGLSVSSIVWAFTSAHSSNWHPLTWISHQLDCQLYGLKPWGHHLTNVILHILNTLLLFLLLGRLTGSMWRSAFVAALFAIHPLHVESVAWIAERKDVLSTAFWLLTMWMYVRYVDNPSIERYVPVIAVYALGLMAKPMLVTLPLVLLLMDYWPLRRWALGEKKEFRWALVYEKLPLLALALVSCVVTFVVQQRSGSVGTISHISIGVRLANALVAYASYLAKMVFPSGLAVIYPHPLESLPGWEVVACAFLLVAVSLAAFRSRKRYPYFAVGWLWYLITLIPVIGIVQVGEQAMADRYTYVPLIGIFIAIAWCIPELLARFGGQRYRRPVAIIAGVVVVALIPCAWVQASYWRDNITLFRHALACTSDNFIAHNNLAAALQTDGQIDEAIAEYQEAVRICPACVPAHSSLADALLSQGKTEEARDQYAEAVRYEPDSPTYHLNLGIALQKLGRNSEAVAEFKEAIRLKPDYAKAHGSLGNSLVQMGETDDAIAEYREVLRIDPGDEIAKRNLEAVQSHRNSPNMRAGAAPDSAQGHHLAGLALAKAGRMDEAVAEYEKALEIDPRSADIHCELGAAYAMMRRTDDAILQFSQALKLNPNHVESHLNLASVLGSQGKLDEAISHFRSAERIKPENVTAHANLAIALYYKQDYAGSWKEVHLCQKYGGTPNPAFVQGLAIKMPDPGG